MSAQSLVLRGHTHGTGVAGAFAHHDATQRDERGGAKGKLLGAEQCHSNDIAPGLELAVNLQACGGAQSVPHQSLLSLGDTNLR